MTVPNPQISSIIKYIIHPDEKISGTIYLKHGKVPTRIILKYKHDAIKKLHELFNMPINVKGESLRYSSVIIQYMDSEMTVDIDTISKAIVSKNIDRLRFIYENGTEAELEVSANDVEEAYKELVMKWKQKIDKEIKIRKKLQEIISKHRIDEVIDIPYYVTDNVRTIDELYDKLIHYLVDEIKNLKGKLKHEAEENNRLNEMIEELEEKLEILRDFITDNDLEDEFVKWYKQKRKEDIEEDLEQEARNIIRYDEYEDDC